MVHSNEDVLVRRPSKLGELLGTGGFLGEAILVRRTIKNSRKLKMEVPLMRSGA